MKAILLKDVPKVGLRGQTVNVSDGFGRNFLINRGLALVATEKNISMIASSLMKSKRDGLAKKSEIIEKLSQADGLELKIEVLANSEGHLFSGLKQKDLSEALNKQYNIQLPNEIFILPKPIKETGEFVIKLIFEESEANLKVKVSSVEEK